MALQIGLESAKYAHCGWYSYSPAVGKIRWQNLTSSGSGEALFIYPWLSLQVRTQKVAAIQWPTVIFSNLGLIYRILRSISRFLCYQRKNKLLSRSDRLPLPEAHCKKCGDDSTFQISAHWQAWQKYITCRTRKLIYTSYLSPDDGNSNGQLLDGELNHLDVCYGTWAVQRS